jgi:hypothetical protein
MLMHEDNVKGTEMEEKIKQLKLMAENEAGILKQSFEIKRAK